jgi:cysteine desulfurase
MEPVYLDHAATTPVRPEILEAMLPFFQTAWGNPSSAHRMGRNARAGLEQGKRETAEALGVEPNQVIFTSGGTEADNLAIIGAGLAAARWSRDDPPGRSPGHHRLRRARRRAPGAPGAGVGHVGEQ